MLGVQHGFAGGIIGLFFSAWILPEHPLIAVGCFLICIWGAILPDWIDPPLSPFHRSIGHNIVSLILFTIMSLVAISLALIFNWWFFIIAAAFFFSVLSHLLLDITTPAGLPLFVGKSFLGIFQIPLFLIPYINIVMIILTIVLAFWSIKFVAKRIGGKLALMLLLIPVWGTLLLLTIALMTIDLLKFLGFITGFFLIITILIIIGIGNVIDASLKNGKNKSKKSNAKHVTKSAQKKKITNGAALVITKGSGKFILFAIISNILFMVFPILPNILTIIFLLFFLRHIISDKKKIKSAISKKNVQYTMKPQGKYLIYTTMAFQILFIPILIPVVTLVALGILYTNLHKCEV